ncbi:MAG: helix-turn-helix domain-containing protein, partial [Myxococcota bacterium]
MAVRFGDVAIGDEVSRESLTRISGHVPLRQAALGQATGLRRETVNRLLKRWERDGLVELSARGLEIDNVAQFSARWADSDEWVGPALNGNPVPRPMSATAEESPQSALLA